MATLQEPTTPSMDAPLTQCEAKSLLPVVAMSFTSVLAAHVLRDAYNLPFMAIFLGLWLMQFALIKLSDFKSFIGMFSEYDIVSGRVRVYAYLYPFIQMLLGLSYLGGYFPFQTSIVLLIVAAFGILSVVLRRNHLVQYCTTSGGSMTAMPFGRVVLVENLLMLVMGAAHLALHMNYWNNVPQ